MNNLIIREAVPDEFLLEHCIVGLELNSDTIFQRLFNTTEGFSALKFTARACVESAFVRPELLVAMYHVIDVRKEPYRFDPDFWTEIKAICLANDVFPIEERIRIIRGELTNQSETSFLVSVALRESRLSEEFELELFNSSNYDFMSQLISNPNLSEATCYSVATHPERLYRSLIRANPACPEAILREFEGFGVDHISNGVIQNPNIPKDLWHEFATSGSLSRMEWDYLYRAKVADMNIIQKRINEGLIQESDMDDISEHPKISNGVALAISKASDEALRVNLARNPSCPDFIFQKIFNSSSTLKHKAFIVQNPNTPIDVKIGVLEAFTQNQLAKPEDSTDWYDGLLEQSFFWEIISDYTHRTNACRMEAYRALCLATKTDARRQTMRWSLR